MKRLTLLNSIFICILLGIYGCGSVPITGRSQLNLVSDHEVLSLSLQEYNSYISTAKKSTDQAATALVINVGRKIADAVETYYKYNGMEAALADYSWEFNLIDDPQVNAFCMPGGKIVVYSGILPITRDETSLAVVLGHEVGHAVAKHANERMSQQLVAQYGAASLGAILSKSSSSVQSISQTVYGLGAQYGVMLPYGRKQELEADYLGLVFMGIAGYNPEAAIPFWERMSQQGSAVPEFMSTHPSDRTRIEDIRKELPEVMELYKAIWGNSNNSTAPATTPATAPASNTSNEWRF